MQVLSPLTTNQQTSGWVLPVSTTRKKQPNGKQLTMALGPDNVLGVGEIGARGNA
ncbi:UNVERIFIED_CONTAM: hypothetical protein Slati_4523100 [Sesamum latifolium]|uniref:Uncharacterized protein n=1 Tax=Sesamum latifolium TaxID=2727402 RepID=A0AAW2SGL5_9LAMI